jgi:hypothetical protein
LLPGVDFSPERALTHDSRSAKSQAADVMATIVAELIVDHLQAANFVAMRRPGRERAFATVAEHNAHHLTVAVRRQFHCYDYGGGARHICSSRCAYAEKAWLLRTRRVTRYADTTSTIFTTKTSQRWYVKAKCQFPGRL